MDLAVTVEADDSTLETTWKVTRVAPEGSAQSDVTIAEGMSSSSEEMISLCEDGVYKFKIFDLGGSYNLKLDRVEIASGQGGGPRRNSSRRNSRR